MNSIIPGLSEAALGAEPRADGEFTDAAAQEARLCVRISGMEKSGRRSPLALQGRGLGGT